MDGIWAKLWESGDKRTKCLQLLAQLSSATASLVGPESTTRQDSVGFTEQ